MTDFLINYVKKRRSENELRSSYAVLSGKTGIVCNILLSAVKFAVGAFTLSVSVIADAVNNLSDSAANIVTLMGTRLSDKPDDKEHPFGHGRLEYVSALIVAVSIFVVSLELAKSSVTKIIYPEGTRFSLIYVVVLLSTVLVKLWMAYFNNKLYKLTENVNLAAVKQDSLNDCVATAATVASLLISHFFALKRIDGIIGIGVSLFIFFSGVELLKQVISPLLGEAPSKELTLRIEEIICENEIVLGVHDLVIHSYGANKKLASADAEVNADTDIFTIHQVIDEAERKILDELGIEICIHMDPVDKNDTEEQKYRLIAEGIIREYNSSYSFHDFRLTDENGKKCVHFDLQVPFEEKTENGLIDKELTARFLKLCPETEVIINIEHSYV